MKKITLVLAAMLLSLTSATATSNLDHKDLRITNRYPFAQPIKFVERGVELLDPGRQHCVEEVHIKSLVPQNGRGDEGPERGVRFHLPYLLSVVPEIVRVRKDDGQGR